MIITYTRQLLHVHHSVISSNHHPETSILRTAGLLGLQEEVLGGQTTSGIHKLDHILHRLGSFVLDSFLFIIQSFNHSIIQSFNHLVLFFVIHCYSLLFIVIQSFFMKREKSTYMRNTHFVQHSKDLRFTLIGRLFHRTAQGSTSRLRRSDRSGGLSSGSSLSLSLSSLGSLLLLALTSLLLVVGILLNRDGSLSNDQSYD